jgi:DNA-binding PadR family transcriptional regulator
VSPVFAHGALRLYLLKLLEEQPRHGYDVIRLLEDRFSGLYSPSAGTIYPRLARLRADGLVERVEEDGRKTYHLTAAGRAELDARRDELADLEERVTGSARDLAEEIRADVRASVRDLREELQGAAREARSERRRAATEARTDLRGLRRELDLFGSDVLAAARREDVGAEALRRVTEALDDARAAVRAALVAEHPDGSR